jgi:hypothetical protein
MLLRRNEMNKQTVIEQYVCRIDYDEAYDIFVNCRDYKGEINTMTKIRSFERYVYIPGDMRIGLFKKRNKLKMDDWVSIIDYMSTLDHPNHNINSSDSLFYVREDGMTLRQVTDYDNHPDRRDFLFMMDRTLMDELRESEVMLPLDELKVRAEERRPEIEAYYRRNMFSFKF